jgi:protoporphyrinogen oxidase
VPSGVFADLLDDRLRDEVGSAYLGRLGSIDYHAALCLLLELDRSFTPFYWTNVADTDLPFVGLIEHTNLIGAERYDGRRFLYVANYLPPDHAWLGLSADELLAVYEPGLRKVNPSFHRSWVRNAWLHREPDAQPIVDLGYHERIPPLRTGAPGLWLANTTQVYPEDRGTNYAVRLGDNVARALLAQAPR